MRPVRNGVCHQRETNSCDSTWVLEYLQRKSRSWTELWASISSHSSPSAFSESLQTKEDSHFVEITTVLGAVLRPWRTANDNCLRTSHEKIPGEIRFSQMKIAETLFSFIGWRDFWLDDLFLLWSDIYASLLRFFLHLARRVHRRSNSKREPINQNENRSCRLIVVLLVAALLFSGSRVVPVSHSFFQMPRECWNDTFILCRRHRSMKSNRCRNELVSSSRRLPRLSMAKTFLSMNLWFRQWRLLKRGARCLAPTEAVCLIVLF